jgi:preprotein translocase subunit SecE
MNTKAENQGKTGALDIVKYALALLIAAAGIYVFYAFTQWPGVVRGLLVALSFVLAFVVLGFTEKGLAARGFFSDSLVVVVIISLILAAFDWVISGLIKMLLGG